jgi:hypothetical protein
LTHISAPSTKGTIAANDATDADPADLRGWVCSMSRRVAAAQREPDPRLRRNLGHAFVALDLIQVAHDHGGDQGETDGDGGGQPVTAMVEPVAI